MAPPTLDQLKPRTAAQQQLVLEEKRAFLSKHPAARRFLFEPSRLWGLIVANRFIPPSLMADGSDLNEYDDLRLCFEGFKRIAYTVLFGSDEDGGVAAGDEGEAPVVVDGASLSAAEKEEIFFKHPFLSPRVFLMFERSVDNFSNRSHIQQQQQQHNHSQRQLVVPETVPAVPLYTFIAKKMLLFRMRIMLELVASVPPPSMRVGPTCSSSSHAIGASSSSAAADHHQQKFCAPSPSSPLSNGLTQEDVEEFIRQLVPHIRLVRDMPQWLMPYYLCHASRKIMFMLDPRGTGAVSIEALMMSEVFSELIRMYESEVRDAVVAFPVGCALEILPSTVVDYGARLAEEGRAGDVSASTAAILKANGGLKSMRNGGSDASVPEWVMRATATGDDDYHLKCSVEDFTNDGNDPTDIYTVSVVCPREFRDVETGAIEVFTVKVPRDALVWCPSTTSYIAPELSAVTNWFSLPLMYRIYDHFTTLDEDSDGVLSLAEFGRYSSSSYTPLAVSRVFDVHIRDSGGRHVMDFKSYLTFVVATEHVGTPQGRRYLWDVLDIEHTKDRITVDALRSFCRELSAKLAEHNLMKITAESILSEVVDMINPAWHEWITREDIDKCRQHHTVLPILLSHRNFYAYDCREQSAAQPSSGEYVQ